MDGQVFSENGQYLYVAHNEANEIYQFESSSGSFESMTLVNTIQTRHSVPTSISLTENNDTMYVVSSYWDLSGITNYPIQLISFSDIPTGSCDVIHVINETNSDGGSNCDDFDRINAKLDGLDWLLIFVCLLQFVVIGWCFVKKRNLESQWANRRFSHYSQVSEQGKDDDEQNGVEMNYKQMG